MVIKCSLCKTEKAFRFFNKKGSGNFYKICIDCKKIVDKRKMEKLRLLKDRPFIEDGSAWAKAVEESIK